MGEDAPAAGGGQDELDTGLGAFGPRGPAFGAIAGELSRPAGGEVFLVLFKLLLQALGAVLGFIAAFGLDLLRGAFACRFFLCGRLFLWGVLAGSGSGGHGVTTG